jgi:hypothetical protein
MIKTFIKDFLALACLIGFVLGLVGGPIFRDCKPESILSTIAVPYRLGCELTVPRFEK